MMLRTVGPGAAAGALKDGLGPAIGAWAAEAGTGLEGGVGWRPATEA
jgi:hypothetical protein